MKRRLLFSFSIFILLAFFLLLHQGLKQDPHILPSTRVGQAAPDFSSITLEQNNHVSAKLFKNHFSLLIVWASWCETCQTEQDYLLALKKDYPHLQLIGLNYKDDPQAARKWLKHYGNPYAVIIQDPQGTIAMDYGVYGTPEIFLVNPDGKILAKHIGVLDKNFFQTKFLPLIAG